MGHETLHCCAETAPQLTTVRPYWVKMGGGFASFSTLMTFISTKSSCFCSDEGASMGNVKKNIVSVAWLIASVWLRRSSWSYHLLRFYLPLEFSYIFVLRFKNRLDLSSLWTQTLTLSLWCSPSFHSFFTPVSFATPDSTITRFLRFN